MVYLKNLDKKLLNRDLSNEFLDGVTEGTRSFFAFTTSERSLDSLLSKPMSRAGFLAGLSLSAVVTRFALRGIRHSYVLPFLTNGVAYLVARKKSEPLEERFKLWVQDRNITHPGDVVARPPRDFSELGTASYYLCRN